VTDTDVTEPDVTETDVTGTDENDLEHEPLLSRAYGIGLLVGGALGLAAAFTLAVDKYRILENPAYQPSCNLNPILSCGSVMITDQAQAFGFPNPLIGLVSFAAVIMFGVLVTARVPVPRWMLGGLAIGSVLGLAFVHWLAFQSLYRIGALCPWCMVVWAVVIPIAVWTVLLLARSFRPTATVAGHVWSARYAIVLAWYLLVFVLALVQFWSYWRTVL
jgi:uncharacterized membrane protein